MDVSHYVDIPFVDGGRDTSGWDCWGLVRYVSAVEFGRELPAYPQAGVVDDRIDPRELGRVVRTRLPEYEAVQQPRPGDIVLLRPRGLPMHVGIVVTKRPVKMLHVERGTTTVVEPVYGPVWKHRVEGFYRYRGDQH